MINYEKESPFVVLQSLKKTQKEFDIKNYNKSL